MMATKKKKAETKAPANNLIFPHPAGAVTARTYQRLALDFTKRAGTKGDDAFVCNHAGAKRTKKPEHPERWEAWLAFFRQIHADDAVRFAVKTGVYAVPARWPWEFSADAAAIEGHLSQLVRAYVRDAAPAPAAPLFSHDERISGREAVQKWREQEKERRVEEGHRLEELTAERGRQRLAFDEQSRLRAFEAAGVTPPPGEVGLSLELMLKSGWRIERDEHGDNVLILPGRGKERG